MDRMLNAGIIEPVEESEWINPIVIEDKKTIGEVRICVISQILIFSDVL